MTIGKIGEFKVQSDDWKLYVERLENYFVVNDIKDDLRVATLITVMGAESYELLVNLCTPHKPSTKTFEYVTAIMEKHLQPKPSVLAERFKFHQRKQNANESIAEYMAVLKKMTKSCEFGQWLEESIRDQFVCGISSEIIRQRLFAEDKLDYTKAYSMAMSMEAAEKNAAAVECGTKYTEKTNTASDCFAMATPGQGGARGAAQYRPAVTGAVGDRRRAAWNGQRRADGSGGGGGAHRPRHVERSSTASAPVERARRDQQCNACGGRHDSTSCKFTRYVCRVCNKQGHLRRVCPLEVGQHHVYEVEGANSLSEDERSDEMCAYSVLAALDGYSPQQDPDQFHIQTDEDDERYFLYQTHNGQYRKERRLKDGSVVGTTGWVGADGYLRLQDYIADGQGYRIYKSKTVYVGENRPISESLQIAKTAPTDSGYGVTPAPAPVHRYRGPPRYTSTTQAPPPSSSYGPPTFPIEVSVTPPPAYPHPTATPQVYVSPNSIDSSTTTYDFRPTVTPITASETAATRSPYEYDSSNTNTLDDEYHASDSKRYDVFNPNSYRHADAWLRRQQQLQQQQQSGVKIGDGYTPQFSTYDGSAFRRNGFRYYLPKQYHEEESGGSNERTGSFGYVDPFGIRRVIYYNTAPGEGFQIRKNNRYVGHDATPYDPRPVN